MCRAPLGGAGTGHRIATTPPPSRGGAGILQTLLRYDKDPIKLAKTIRTIFRELDPIIGDPEVMPVDLKKLAEGPRAPPPAGGTSHYCVVDSEGTVVSAS